MSFSSVDLWQRISASQLASPMICRAWAADAAAKLNASDAIDGRKVADQLVAQGKLTQFQAETLIEGLNQPLVLHGYRLLQPVHYQTHAASDVRSLFQGWWLAAKTPTTPPTWMRWLDAEELKQPKLADAQPTLPRLLQHAQIQHSALQTVHPPEMADGRLQLSLQPVSGQLLSALCDGQPKPLEMVTRIWTELASGLSALHAAGLSHGRVTPDRVCVGADGRPVLLRDPLCGLTLVLPKELPKAAAGRSATGGLLLQRLPGRLTAAHLMAPEFLLPAQAPTPQSDIYALGCLVWMLLVGKPPFHADQPEKILAAHAEKPLNQAAVASLPPPLAKCLWHCLAKNPNARFASGQQLFDSLQEAQRLIAIGPTRTVPATAATTQPASADPANPPTAPQPQSQVKVDPIVDPSTNLKPPLSPSSTVAPAPVAPAPVNAAPVNAAPVNAAPANTVPVNAVPVNAVPIESGNVEPAVAAAANAPAANAPAATGPGGAAKSTAAPRRAAPGKPPARRAAQRGVRKATGKRKSQAWLTPVIGGGGLVILILMLILFRGSGNPTQTAPENSRASANTSPNTSTTSGADGSAEAPPPADPMLERFELVEAKANALWAPPRVAQPLALDLLPPGAQAYISVRPARLLQSTTHKQLLSLFDADLNPYWNWLYQLSGVPLESIDQATVAAYPGHAGQPQYALRVKLLEPWPLSKLKGAWNLTAELKVGQQTLLVSNTLGFYVAQQPLVDSQSVASFSVGFTELMREVAGMRGSQGPMASALEQLWQNTDQSADFNLLLNPTFLFTEGRGWLETSPQRLRVGVQNLLPRDTRGLMLTSSVDERWFYELRLVGSSDRDAVANQQKLGDWKDNLPQQVEMWLVNELAHPYWRALANRYPNMLRALGSQTRVGAESGQAIANGYLPASAAPNLVYASWMALQPTSTVAAASGIENPAVNTSAALTPMQILDRKITLSVDPTGIEFILAQIGEQANENLPPGTRPLQFELNGTAFQLAGFTRNQQIRDYKVENQTVREALSLLVKKGNPVQPLDDLRSPDQKMIWVITNPDNPEKALVSLTSRESALAAGQTLPSEFAPQ